MGVKYIEENGIYALDCTNAVWSTDKIHNDYQDPAHTFGVVGFLCDVDFVIETESSLLLVEYKNANIPCATNPDAFVPNAGNKLDKVARKYYDSIHWLVLSGKNKPKKYIYILEYPAGNSTSRLMIRNQLQSRLPFAMQRELSGNTVKIIDDIRVVDIAEWNADAELGQFPLLPVTASVT